MDLLSVLLCLLIVAVLAIYWTVWKTRNELNQNLKKMVLEFTQIGQSLQKKPVGN